MNTYYGKAYYDGDDYYDSYGAADSYVQVTSEVMPSTVCLRLGLSPNQIIYFTICNAKFLAYYSRYTIRSH